MKFKSTTFNKPYIEYVHYMLNEGVTLKKIAKDFNIFNTKQLKRLPTKA